MKTFNCNLSYIKQTGSGCCTGKAYAATTEHEDAPREDLSLRATCLNLQIRRRLRKLCWETMFGQELVKLTVMDLVSV